MSSKKYEDTDGFTHGKIGHKALEWLYKRSFSFKELKTLIEIEYRNWRLSLYSLFMVDKSYRYDPAKIKARMEITLAQVEMYRAKIFSSEKVNYLSAEPVVTVPIRTPNGKISPRYEFKTIIDGLFRDENGDLCIHEIKFKGQWSESQAIYLKIDPQITSYFYSVWKKTGEFPKKAVYTILTKPGYRVTKNESVRQWGQRVATEIRENPEKYILRYEASRTLEDMEYFEQQLYHDALIIGKAHRSKSYKEPPFMAMEHWKCTQCDFFENCFENGTLDKIHFSKYEPKQKGENVK